MNNKLVYERYPAAKLPSDLREGLDPKSEVKVTIEVAEVCPHRVLSLEEILSGRRPPYRSAEEIDAEIRQSRDEWDE